jgi:N6-adenine-specific methylase
MHNPRRTRPASVGTLEGNLLFHCDNLACIRCLQKAGFAGSIDLIYIDPPFQSGEHYYHRIKNKSDLAFKDVWKHDEYFEMLGVEA